MRTRWRGRAWRDRAIAWAERRLAEQHIAITGRPDQFHVRPWSTVIRLQTDRGPIFFKATCPAQRYEAAVTQALARWRPDDVSVVLAAEPRRGWLLLADGGKRLRQVLARDRSLRHWRAILPRYAEMQVALAPRADELVRLGIPDRRVAPLAAAYQRLLRKDPLLRIGLPEGLTPVQYRELLELAPRVRQWSEEISALVPNSIQHDDLHDGQVFLKDGRYRILDWGDACVSHPLMSMSVVERSLAYTFKLKPGAREIARLRDLYLEPFTTVATAKHLRVAYPIAIRLGWITRALAWASLVGYLSSAEKRKERGDVPRSLGRVLDPMSA